MSITLHNETNEQVVIPWTETRPVFSLKREGQPLRAQSDCHAPCDTDCTCGSCGTSIGVFVRIPPHSDYSFDWQPKRYVLHPCGKQPDCRCTETWPLTAGNYEITVEGFSRPRGGQPVKDDERLVVGVDKGPDSQRCVARFQFTLQRRGKASAAFMCLVE
jgi:hypothetical protein